MGPLGSSLEREILFRETFPTGQLFQGVTWRMWHWHLRAVTQLGYDGRCDSLEPCLTRSWQAAQ